MVSDPVGIYHIREKIKVSIGAEPSFTPSGRQVIYDTPKYEYGMLAAGKRMTPMRAHVRARRKADFADYIRHPGEEFVYLLAGRLAIHFENGRVFRFHPGDSLYFDSAIGHLYLSGISNSIPVECVPGMNCEISAQSGS